MRLVILVVIFGGTGFWLMYGVQGVSAMEYHATGTLYGRSMHTLPHGCVDDHKTDYSGAIDCIVNQKRFDCNITPDKDPCTYESAQRPTNYPLQFVVIHDIEGTAIDGINTFHNRESQSSVHYVVDTDGTVYQLLREQDIAYHAGNYWYNQRAIGIEHAGYAASGYQWYSPAEYQASARLTAYLLEKYHIPLDHAHVLGHGIIPASTLAVSPNHTDPGPYWLWDYYFALVHEQGVPFADADSRNPATIMLHSPAYAVMSEAGGRGSVDDYSFASLYNGPSTASGLVPHASGLLDELANVEPEMSYAFTDRIRDPAGSGKTLYQIWYGVETHINDRHRSNYASARQVWLAVANDDVTQGYGIVIHLSADTKIYSCPDDQAKYQIGESPAGALFDSPDGAMISQGQFWYMINYNHRQAWVPASVAV